MNNKDAEDEPAARAEQHIAAEEASAPGTASSSLQLARSQQATEAAFQRIQQEFGLLRIEEVAELLGARPISSELLGVRRDGIIVFPGYQFDRGERTVRLVIEPLLALARANSWSNESLALWLIGPSTSFEADGRPVDHLADQPEAVLASARDTMEALG